MVAVLFIKDDSIVKLEYEPRLVGLEGRIDFRLSEYDGLVSGKERCGLALDHRQFGLERHVEGSDPGLARSSSYRLCGCPPWSQGCAGMSAR